MTSLLLGWHKLKKQQIMGKVCVQSLSVYTPENAQVDIVKLASEAEFEAVDQDGV